MRKEAHSSIGSARFWRRSASPATGLAADRREQLDELLAPDGEPILPAARTRIERMLDRLELVMKQIAQIETARDAVVKPAEPADAAERMIRDLSLLCGIGPELATRLTRETFVRDFRDRRALAGYVGLCGSPFSSGGSHRDQVIAKDGNKRVRAAMVELAWLWLRWQEDSALTQWYRGRVEQAKGRIKKILIVALARKLLIALWRYAMEGVLPEGAKMKTA